MPNDPYFPRKPNHWLNFTIQKIAILLLIEINMVLENSILLFF